MVAANTSVSVNLTKTFEILPSDMGEYTEVRIEVYKDPSKGSVLKEITKKLEGIKYNKKKVFENSQIKKISDAILEVSKNDNPISEFNITGKMDGMPRHINLLLHTQMHQNRKIMQKKIIQYRKKKQIQKQIQIIQFYPRKRRKYGQLLKRKRIHFRLSKCYLIR